MSIVENRHQLQPPRLNVRSVEIHLNLELKRREIKGRVNGNASYHTKK